MGRNAAGVRGMKLAGAGDEVIALIIIGDGPDPHGHGERLRQAHAGRGHPVQGRGGQGVIALQTSERNGELVGALQVSPDDELMLISPTGTLVRTPVGRNLDRWAATRRACA